MLDLFTLLVFALVFVGVYAFASVSGRARRREAVKARLAALAAETGTETSAADTSVVRALDDYTGPLPKVHGLYARVKKDIEMLGWAKNIRVRAGLLALVSFVTAGFIGRMTEWPVATALAGGVVIFVSVAVVLYLRAMSLWTEGLAQALPEAIDSIARICRAGVPAQTAFGLAAQNLTGPLSDELKSIDRWLKLGVTLKQVLQESAQRVPLAEYRFFAVILIISQESGGRLADTLERLAATLRERSELELKVQAKTSEARASIKIVACLVPGVLLYQYIQAPQDFQFLVTDPTGLKVLLYAAVSVAAGLLITWLMVRRIQ